MKRKPHTERYIIFCAACKFANRKPSTVEYAAWVGNGAHAFRKAERLSPVAPIGKSEKFTAFLREWGWYGIPF